LACRATSAPVTKWAKYFIAMGCRLGAMLAPDCAAAHTFRRAARVMCKP
jgi:hypothetical protein